MGKPAPASIDRKRVQLALTFWVAPGCVLVALCAAYALSSHGLRWAIAALLLLMAACGALAGMRLARTPARPLLGHGGAALAVYCLSVLAGFGLVLALLVSP